MSQDVVNEFNVDRRLRTTQNRKEGGSLACTLAKYVFARRSIRLRSLFNNLRPLDISCNIRLPRDATIEHWEILIYLGEVPSATWSASAIFQLEKSRKVDLSFPFTPASPKVSTLDCCRGTFSFSRKISEFARSPTANLLFLVFFHASTFTALNISAIH